MKPPLDPALAAMPGWLLGLLTVLGCGGLLLTLVVGLVFIGALQRALRAVSPRNRLMEPGAVWLLLMPIFNLYWIFMVASRVSASLGNEFRARNQDDGSDYGRSAAFLWVACAVGGNVAVNLAPIPGMALTAFLIWGLLFMLGFFFLVIFWTKVSLYTRQLEEDPRGEEGEFRFKMGTTARKRPQVSRAPLWAGIATLAVFASCGGLVSALVLTFSAPREPEEKPKVELAPPFIPFEEKQLDAKIGPHRQFMPPIMGGFIKHVSFSPDGKRVHAVSDMEGVYDWDLDTGKGKTLKNTIQSFPEVQFVTVALAPGASRAYFSRKVNGLYYFDLGSPDPQQVELKHDVPDAGYYHQIAVSPDGKQVATADSRWALLWDSESGKPIHKARAQGSMIEFLSSAYHPSGKFVAFSSRAAVHVMDVKTGTIENLAGEKVPGGQLKFSPDGKLLSAIKGPWLGVWPVDVSGDTPKIIPKLRFGESHKDDLAALAFSPDGKIVAVATSGDRSQWTKVFLYDTDTGEQRGLIDLGQRAGSNFSVRDLAFHPDGRRLALGCLTCVFLFERERFEKQK